MQRLAGGVADLHTDGASRSQLHMGLTGDHGNFPHVAGPIVGLGQIQAVLTEVLHQVHRTAGHVLEEMTQQGQDVLTPFCDRRQTQFQDLQTVIQVGTEPAVGHRLLQIRIGRGDQAQVGEAFGRITEGLVRTVLQQAQQPRLQFQRQVADFIEKQRAAVGLGCQPDAIAVGTAEGATGMAKELALENRLGNGRDVHAHQFPGSASTLVVQAPCEQLFAGAGFAGHQHGLFTVGKSVRQLDHVPHARRNVHDGCFDPALHRTVHAVGRNDHPAGLFRVRTQTRDIRQRLARLQDPKVHVHFQEQIQRRHGVMPGIIQQAGWIGAHAALEAGDTDVGRQKQDNGQFMTATDITQQGRRITAVLGGGFEIPHAQHGGRQNPFDDAFLESVALLSGQGQGPGQDRHRFGLASQKFETFALPAQDFHDDVATGRNAVADGQGPAVITPRRIDLAFVAMHITQEFQGQGFFAGEHQAVGFFVGFHQLFAGADKVAHQAQGIARGNAHPTQTLARVDFFKQTGRGLQFTK